MEKCLFLLVCFMGFLEISTFELSLTSTTQLYCHYHLPSIKKSHKHFVQMMSILPIRRKQMAQMAPRKVTNEQWKSYWGMNSKERLQKVMESVLMTYGGLWFAWFISFMSGGLVAAVVGTALVFNWIYLPWLNAKDKNQKLWSSVQQEPLHYALFTGTIKSLRKIRRKAGKTVGAVAQEFLVLIIEDEMDRQLEIITQWQVDYKKLHPLMRCETIIASTSKDFSSIATVTELFVKSCDVWVGDYPYLDRYLFDKFLSSFESEGRDMLQKIARPSQNIWDKDVGEFENRTSKLLVER